MDKERLEQIQKQSKNGVQSSMTRPTKAPSIESRYTVEQVRDCIHRHFGIFTAICNELDCTFYALTKYARKNKLEGDINEARGTLMEVAQDAILGCLNSKDERVRLDAAKFTLKTLGKEKGWSENPNFAVNIQIEDSERDKKIRAIFGLSDEPKEIPQMEVVESDGTS